MQSHSAPPARHGEGRTLRIAIIVIAIVEAIAMVPLILHIANK